MSKPFVKWAGGKFRLAEQLIPFIPKSFDSSINKYIEPMVGSGGFFFKYAPNNAYLSDINNNLVITYNIIKNDVKSLIKLLKKHKKLHSKDYFYNSRDRFNSLIKIDNVDLEVASLFIYLNRTCFNGLYRENSKGEFNVPIGSYKNPLICDEENLKLVSKVLENVEVCCHGFDDSLKNIKTGDFVYLDPPYIPIDTSSFTKYSKNDFGLKHHEDLSSFCDKINEKGAFFMLSNSDTEFTNDIYLKEGRFVERFLVNRSIASKASNRKKAKEVIITNYKI